MLYREGEKSVLIDAEFLATNGVVLETISIRAWDPPHDGEAISCERIVRRAKEALEFGGLTVYVDDA